MLQNIPYEEAKEVSYIEFKNYPLPFDQKNMYRFFFWVGIFSNCRKPSIGRFISVLVLLWRAYYAPNFEEVEGAYWFRVVPSSHACVRSFVALFEACHEPCMLGFWNFIYGFLMVDLFQSWSCCYYAPNFEEVEGAYWFRVVRAPVRASVRPFVTLYEACHILWTVHARIFKFHIWIPHRKVADPYFFLVQVISLSGVMPLWNQRPIGHNAHLNVQLHGFWEEDFWMFFFSLENLAFQLPWPPIKIGDLDKIHVVGRRLLQKHFSKTFVKISAVTQK